MDRNILKSSRVYLSGPMDFVGSRIVEKFFGWRAILTPVLRALHLSVLDPWNKPEVLGHREYGKEGVINPKSVYEKDFWTNNETRAQFETDFWETVHIDLRMCDLSDFLIAFTPTNVYSVGTVHEIVVARNQLKPTLLVSPPVKYEFFPEIDQLSDETKEILKNYGLKENPQGLPSQWYGNIVGGHYFFDGFGWENLNFKASNFYETLIENILELSKPQDHDESELERWENVKEWVETSEYLKDLKGGIMDYIEPEEEEKEYLKQALEDAFEKERKYFWYNHPYKPKRPLLYHLFSIASGRIPPRMHIMNSLDEDGKVVQKNFEVTDDAWVLISQTKPD